MWTTDFYLGAVWTLICIVAGGMLTIVTFAAFRRDDPPGPPEDEDPVPDTISPGPVFEVDDDTLAAWLQDNTITELPEANLLRR